MVDDVAAAVRHCEKQFGWGPFHRFKAAIAESSYKRWRGEKLTEVALGMAGKVQVEFLHVHKGCDTTADYQAEYGTGFQHLGIHSCDRDEALQRLQGLGAKVNELNEFPGVRIAFVDVPTGPGMFEILEPTAEMANNKQLDNSHKVDHSRSALLGIDRASIVTADMDAALSFYAEAFGWGYTRAETATLLYGHKKTTVRRYLCVAGALQLELIEPANGTDDPYSRHLRRGTHGLIHAGGTVDGELPSGESLYCEWQETGERFALYTWAGGENGLQIRLAN